MIYEMDFPSPHYSFRQFLKNGLYGGESNNTKKMGRKPNSENELEKKYYEHRLKIDKMQVRKHCENPKKICQRLSQSNHVHK